MAKRLFLAAAFLLLGTPIGASAQLLQASAAALGLGFNNTASARSFAAVANNPAGLGHPGSVGFSLSLAAVDARAGLGPIALSDIAAYDGVVVPDPVKRRWLERAVASGGQNGSIELGATPLAMSIGSFGFQFSTVAVLSSDLNDDAVELLLFGNAGLTGIAGDYDLEGSAVDGVALSTGAISFGTRAGEGLWLGVTGKYTVGHGAVIGRDVGSSLRSSPLQGQIQFPVIIPRTEDPEIDNGSGFGMDLGVLYQRGRLTFGGTVQNVFNTFSWRPDGFSFVPGEALVDIDGGDADFDERPASSAPQALLTDLDEFTLRPSFAVGVEFRSSAPVILTADVRGRTEGGIEFGPAFHAGVGAELTALSFLPLRGHFAVMSGGVQAGGGASLVLGPVNLSGGLAVRTRELGSMTVAAVALSFGAN
jgi:hypothetical protein